jgi:hypothetical protein
VRASEAPVELALDLRATPPDKVLPRLFGALDRVSADVTLLVLLRDTPEYVGVTASAHAALQQRDYVSDTSRIPGGGQRLRVQRRREPHRGAARGEWETEAPRDPAYAPPPEPVLSPTEPATEASADADVDGAPGVPPSVNGQHARPVNAPPSAGVATEHPPA